MVLTSFLAFLCGIALLAGILAPQFLNTILAPGFDQPASALTAALTRIMLLQALIALVVSVGRAVLNSRQQFTLSGLAIIVHNIAMISGILIVRVVPGLGIYGATLGVVADGLLQLLILIPGLWLNQVHFRYAWNTADRRLRQVVALLIPNGLSAVVNYGGTIVDTAYVSLARESVALPALQNALLVIGFPIRLFGIAIGQAGWSTSAPASRRGWTSTPSPPACRSSGPTA